MAATAVTYFATPWGYTVTTIGEDGETLEVYQAGNHPDESTVRIEPSAPHAVRIGQLRKWARQTAEETARALGLDNSAVGHDADGEAEERDDKARLREALAELR